MKLQLDRAYQDIEYGRAEDMPDALPLNIISGGCHLYGYVLKPGRENPDKPEQLHPAVVMFHGFPGYTTNNDLEYALMRMGCVVFHVNHRGAWGSEGNYLFSNLVDDAVAIAKWVNNPATTSRYKIDENAIFLVGHSMGGMTVLNAAKELGFIRGVAAVAPYDLDAAFQNGLEKELFIMIEGEGQCLNMTSASEVYENAHYKSREFALIDTYHHLRDQNVMFVAAQMDTVAPPDIMVKPIYDRLTKNPGKGQYEYVPLPTNHGLCGQRTVLARVLGKWMNGLLSNL